MATRQQILAGFSKRLAAIKARAEAIAKKIEEKVAAKKSKVEKPVLPTPSAYTGLSIVDYLKSAGQASSFTSRAKLATQHGITNYRGTAEQNTRLLKKVRGF